MNVLTNAFQINQANANVNWNSDTFNWILCSGNYVENDLVNVSAYGQLSASELPSQNGYIRGGVQVASSAYINQDNICVYDIGSPTWTASAGPIGEFRYAALRDVTRSDLVVYLYDFKKNYTVNDGGTLKINITNGLFNGVQTLNCKE